MKRARYAGFFTWKENATIDGVSKNVIASPIGVDDDDENEQKMYLEQMAVVRGMVYHRDSPIFKGKSYTGKIVFDPLPKTTREVRLQIKDFVLEFGIYDIPKTLLTMEFPLSVEQRIVEPEVGGRAAGM